MKILLRPVQISDLFALQLLEKKVFGENFSNSVFEVSKKTEDWLGYIAIIKKKFFGFYKHKIIGFIKMSNILDEFHIDSFGVDPLFRRISIGELLLVVSLIKSIEIGSKICTLEVRKSNFNAQNLYSKYKFQTKGIRKNYYSINRENALIMTAQDINSDEYLRFLFKQIKKMNLEYTTQSCYYYKIPSATVILRRIISLFNNRFG